MAIASILLALLAFVCTVVGVLTTPIPMLGLGFSFAGMLAALGGAFLAGRVMSAAKRASKSTDVGCIAVVMNLMALIPAAVVTLTCGVCNYVVSTGDLHVQPNLDFRIGPNMLPAAGSDAPQRPPPEQPPSDQPAEPGTLPPPPLPAGPGK
jgi:hypothetical protein